MVHLGAKVEKSWFKMYEKQFLVYEILAPEYLIGVHLSYISPLFLLVTKLMAPHPSGSYFFAVTIQNSGLYGTAITGLYPRPLFSLLKIPK